MAVMRIWIVVGLLLCPLLANATTITVTSTDFVLNATNGDCTLFEAIKAAEQDVQYDQCPAGGESDTIVLAKDTLYQLDQDWGDDARTGLPYITKNITIDGNGATIQRNPSAPSSFRIFYVESSGSLTIKNAKVRFGHLDKNSQSGGAGIYVSGGKLVLDNVVLQTNLAPDKSGGSLYLGGQFDALIKNSIITTSKALNGGGIFADGNKGKLVIEGGQFAWNTANYGGAIKWYTSSSVLSIKDVSFLENKSLLTGGALEISAYSSDVVTIDQCEFKGNESVTGGGIRANGGNITILKSGFEGNKANYLSNSAPGEGGAIAVFKSSFDIRNTTFTKNSASKSGAALYSYDNASGVIKNATIYDNLGSKAVVVADSSQPVVLIASIVLGNAAGDCQFTGNGLQSGGNNVIVAGNGCPLANNYYYPGKPADLFATYLWSSSTSAYVPSASSYLIDKITPGSCNACPQDDQWGHVRGVNRDVGSLEAICGDSVVHTKINEQCDDGNTVEGDGCDAKCQFEICGNGLTQAAEQCDDGNVVAGDGCNALCQAEVGYNCSGTPSKCHTGCGDGIKAGAEQCDDGNMVNGDGCDSLCIVEMCGNNYVQHNEFCDDGNVVDGDGCSKVCRKEYCGDDVLHKGLGEACDTNQLNGKTCETMGMGFDSGTLSCNSQCKFDTSQCKVTPKPSCGDGVRNGAEICEGADLGGETCVSLNQGFVGGGLSCKADCSFDTTLCNLPPQEVCGDAKVQDGEQCDGGNLNKVTCAVLGFESGDLKCTQCKFDTTGCKGSAVIEAAIEDQKEGGKPNLPVPGSGMINDNAGSTPNAAGDLGGASSGGGGCSLIR